MADLESRPEKMNTHMLVINSRSARLASGPPVLPDFTRRRDGLCKLYEKLKGNDPAGGH